MFGRNSTQSERKDALVNFTVFNETELWAFHLLSRSYILVE